jgi:hypothetical protein
MIEWLATTLIVLSLLLALAALGHLVLNRRMTTWLLGGLVVLEALLLVQFVVGLVMLLGGDNQVAAVTFVGYLVGILLILPFGTLWALGDPERSGTAVLVVATLVVATLVVRLEQIWAAGV